MEKILILSSLLLVLFAGSNQAAGTSYMANRELNHALNYLECKPAPASEKESGQTPAPKPGISGTRIATSSAASQKVLCGQCHQNSMATDKLTA